MALQRFVAGQVRVVGGKGAGKGGIKQVRMQVSRSGSKGGVRWEIVEAEKGNGRKR